MVPFYLFRGHGMPLKTKMTLENPPFFNRKFTSSFMVDCPASHGIFFWGKQSSFNVHVSPCFAMLLAQMLRSVGWENGRGILVEWALTSSGGCPHELAASVNPSCWFMYAWMNLISICTYMFFRYHTDVHTWFNLFTSELEPNEIYRTWCVSTRIISRSKLFRCFQVFFSHESFTNIPRMTAMMTCAFPLFFVLSVIRKSQDMYNLMQWYILHRWMYFATEMISKLPYQCWTTD